MPSIPDDILPPTLPPFNIPMALSRINNNSQLLRKLLFMFVESYGATVPTLRSHLLEGRREDAIRLAHSLKGTAGILDAVELAAAASAVEQLLKEGKSAEAEFAIGALELALAPALGAAGSLGRVPTEATNPSPSGAVDLRERAAALTDLRNKIASNNVRARKLYAQLRGNLLGLGMDEDIALLGNRLDALDFAEALSLLDELLRKIDDRQGDVTDELLRKIDDRQGDENLGGESAG